MFHRKPHYFKIIIHYKVLLTVLYTSGSSVIHFITVSKLSKHFFNQINFVFASFIRYSFVWPFWSCGYMVILHLHTWHVHSPVDLL